jgi:hypothetical protein
MLLGEFIIADPLSVCNKRKEQYPVNTFLWLQGASGP